MEVKKVIPSGRNYWESCIQRYWEREKEKWELRNQQKK